MTEVLHWRTIAPDAAFHVARFWKTPADPTRLHTHDFAEVFWIDAGTGTQSGPAGRQALQAGDLVFIRPPDVHALESNGRMQLTNVAFPVDTYDWLRHRYPTPWTDEPSPVIHHLEPGQLHRLTRAAEDIFSGPRTRLSIERFLLDLLHMLTRQPLPVLPAGAPDWFRRACSELSKPEHFRQGAPAVAKLAGRSAEHVARVTRELLHETPTDLVNRVRLQYAAQQLALTDAKIMDIALDCGLTNLSYFYRLFRRQFGATPQAYRQQQRGLV